MAVTAADVQAFAPQFAAVSSGVINTWLAMASGAINADILGAETDNATLLWVAHQLTKTTGGAAGQVGAVTGREVGEVRVQASPGTSDTAAMRTTAYGAAFLQLIRRFTAGGVVAL
jgi:hypothetical protein